LGQVSFSPEIFIPLHSLVGKWHKSAGQAADIRVQTDAKGRKRMQKKAQNGLKQGYDGLLKGF